MAVTTAALAAGCAGFSPPGPELELLLRASAPAETGPHRTRATATVDSPWFGGVFEAVLAAEPGPHPRVRLQLFPGIGGKVLDVVAGPERITGVLPQAGLVTSAEIEAAFEPPRELLFFVGVTLLEMHAPILASRVRGARAAGSETELWLEPLVPGTEVHAWVGATGEVLERRYSCRGARWREQRRGELVIEGGPFRLSVQDQASVEADALPESAFELELP